MNEPLKDRIAAKLIEQFTDLVNHNAAEITDKLTTSEKGKISISAGSKLALAGTKLVVRTKMKRTESFEDDCEGVLDIDDPKQPRLAGMERPSVTISTEGTDSVVIDAKSAKRIIKTCDAILKEGK